MPDANMLPENSLCQRAVSYLIIVVTVCINRFVIRLDDKKKGPFSLQLARRVPEGCQENGGRGVGRLGQRSKSQLWSCVLTAERPQLAP